MAKTSETQLKANAKYDAANTRTLQLKLNKNTDKDILDWLDLLPNKQGEIKRLIRKEMAEIKATEEAYNNEYDEDGFWVGYRE